MKRHNRFFRWIGLFAVTALVGMWCFSGILTAEIDDSSNAEWPQWRGPNRDGISHETGFLKNWPAGGPKVIWRVPLGEGFSGISISQGRAYTMYAQGGDEFVVCLDAATGQQMWRFRSDEIFNDHQGGNGPRSTPTVDGDLVFALSAYGKLYALNAKNGEKLWTHDLKREFGGKVPQWGFSASPLVEGVLLLIEAGGNAGKSLIAFDKKSGREVWASQTDAPGYSSPIAITVNGVRQVIFFTGTTLVSVSPVDGKLYWRHSWQTSYDVNAATPVFLPNDKVFISSGYDKGATVLQMKVNSGRVTVEEIWKSRVMKSHFASSVLHGNYLYGFDNAILKCIDANTGKEQWAERGFGKGSLMSADGHLIILGERGNLALAEATPLGYREKASAQVLNGRCWTVPTLAGGKLYMRNQKEMVCLDMSGQN